MDDAKKSLGVFGGVDQSTPTSKPVSGETALADENLPDESKQRVGIFVDVQNMYYSARNIKKAKINYEQLMDFLLNGRCLIRAVAYLLNKEDVDQKSFIGALRNIGYDVRVKFLKMIGKGETKGDWKVELPLEVMAIAPKIDVAILVTGNGDYAPLLDHLKKAGVRAEVAGFESNTSVDLVRGADEFIPLTDEVLTLEKKFETATAVVKKEEEKK